MGEMCQNLGVLRGNRKGRGGAHAGGLPEACWRLEGKFSLDNGSDDIRLTEKERGHWMKLKLVSAWGTDTEAKR